MSTPPSPAVAAGPGTAGGRAPYAVVLPVKPPARGKSRLADAGDEGRAELARAFALDAAQACLATPLVGAVLVVTDDAVFAAEAGGLGCDAIPDGVSGDLNGSLLQAAAEVVRRWPGVVPVALCADLPALRPADLMAALGAIAPGTPAYVADADGTGTTLYTAPYEAFTPRFGLGSARLHGETGALAIAGELPSLRRDVDTLADLRSALPLGLGARTTLVASRRGLLVD
jgi:2-phospho-L-lactate/phosphoenolpyruvate guanylyltransferase